MPCETKVERLAAINIKVESSYGQLEIGKCRIDEDLLSILKPLNLAQAICLFDKYKVKKGIITPNSLCYNILSVIGSTVVLMVSISTKNLSLSLATKAYSFVVTIGYIVNYYSNISRQSENILLVIKTQDLVSYLKSDRSFIRYLTIYNWICIFAINFITFSLACFYFYIVVYFSIFDFMRNYLSVHFDVNIVYNTVFIKIACKATILWLEDVQKLGLSDEINDEYWRKMFNMYVKILKAYRLTARSFELLIMYYIVYTFLGGMIDATWVLQIKDETRGKSNFLPILILPQVWLAKNILLTVYLCVEYEKFYAKQREVHCILYWLQLHRKDFVKRSVGEKIFFNNVHRYQTNCFNKMATGLFTVDAKLPLQLTSLITTYMVAQLQYILLKE